MLPEDTRRLRELFQAAVAREGQSRVAFVAEASSGDAELSRELEQLLAAHDRAWSLLDGTTHAAAPTSLDGEYQAPAVGRRFGAYLVIRELGRGGMGAVYLAERADDEFRKQVAIKLIERGGDSASVLRHFRAERQILASLEHPNIARLIDGGTSDDGSPYFVMEYIEGQPIDAYCDAHQLPISARLELFRQAGAAVSYAHQRLVVHRDLKPSNILVGPDGVVKLLDFGIAKILDPDASGPHHTATVSDFMTPAYASPEQIEGRPATTLTDVYSLGAILYELLTGRRPHATRGRSLAEALLAVCTLEPERPSTAVFRAAPPGGDGTAVEPTPEAVSRPREGSPQRLRRRLSGDLDTIVMMALRKEPARRYRSVEHLCDDLRRHLVGLPVSAREETLGYRLGKFVKRHRGGVAAAAAFVALGVGFLTNTIVQSGRVARERDKAERVAAFLQNLFTVADPSKVRGNTITAREVLDHGAARISRELGGEPEVQASLLDTMGRVYSGLGLYDRAGPLLEEALALRRRELGAQHGDVGRTLDALGNVRYAKGEYAQAEALYSQALSIWRRVAGGDHEEVAVILTDLGNARGEQSKYAEGEANQREALAMRRRLFGNEHRQVADSLASLALLRRWQGDLAGAVALYRESLAMRRKILGNDDPDVAHNLDNLAGALFSEGEDAAAERSYREAYDLNRRLYGEQHPNTAMSLHNLAMVAHAKGDLAAAEPLYREALARQRRALGSEHPDVALTLSNLAGLLSEEGKDAEAEAVGREALTLRRKLLGSEHPNVAWTATNLALSLRRLGRLGEAETMLREALRVGRKAFPKGHSTVAWTLLVLADVLDREGRGREGEPLAREGLAIRARTFAPGSADIAEAESILGGCLVSAGRYDEAEVLLVRSHAALDAAYGKQNANTRDTVQRLVALYTARGRLDRAREYRAALAP